MRSSGVTTMLTVVGVSAVCCILSAGTTRAHGDTMNGPVVVEARAALEKGDLVPRRGHPHRCYVCRRPSPRRQCAEGRSRGGQARRDPPVIVRQDHKGGVDSNLMRGRPRGV